MPQPTRKQKQEASRQLRKKLILERKLERKMRVFLKKQTDQIFNSYSGKVGKLSDAELKSILENHYADAAAEFVPAVLDEINVTIGATGKDKLTTKDKAVAAALLLFISKAVQESVKVIQKTTRAKVERHIEKADTLSGARANVHAVNVSRSKNIATTENQKAVEGSKHHTASSASKALKASAIAILIRQKKTWVAVIDKDTRGWHASANGTTINIDKPFEISGEKLMYPGDFSMGATGKNLNFCRCVSINSTSIVT